MRLSSRDVKGGMVGATDGMHPPHHQGGPDMEHVEPKLDHFFGQAAEWAGTKLPVSKVNAADLQTHIAGWCRGLGTRGERSNPDRITPLGPPHPVPVAWPPSSRRPCTLTSC